MNQNIDLSNIPSTQVKRVIKYDIVKLPPTFHAAPTNSFAGNARIGSMNVDGTNQQSTNLGFDRKNSILSRGMSPMISRRN